MWQIIADNLMRGMGAAGWVIGFVALLGAFLIVVGVIGLGLVYAFGGTEGDDDEGDA